MTTRDQVRTYLDFALQQVAAESYLHELPSEPDRRQLEIIRRLKYGFNDPTHSYIQAWVDRAARAGEPSQDADTPMLPGHNRMPDPLARGFVQRYQVVDHLANDLTGFSATLLFDTQRSEYTLAMRSTEFRSWNEAGDQERDMFGANQEIA